MNAIRAEMTRRGFQCVTPEGNRSAILTFAYRDAGQLASRLDAAKVRITLRGNHIRISPSTFNDMNDIDRLLSAIGNP